MVIRIEVAWEAENFIQLQLSDIWINISQVTAKRILNGQKIDVKNFNVDRFIASIRDRANWYIQRYWRWDNLLEEKKEIQNMILRLEWLPRNRLIDNDEKDFRKQFFDDLRLLFWFSTHKELAQKILWIGDWNEIRYHQIKNWYLSISENLEMKIRLLLEEALLK